MDVTLTLSADPEREVVIPLTAIPSGGANSDDYSGVPAGLTFNAGETSKTITLTAADDTGVEIGETVYLYLSTLPVGVTSGAATSTTITLIDTDFIYTMSFSPANYRVREDVGAIPITTTIETPAGGARIVC